MGENGGAKYYQQSAFTPMDVSIDINHQQAQGGPKCYDDDGKLKRTGKEKSPPALFHFNVLKLLAKSSSDSWEILN